MWWLLVVLVALATTIGVTFAWSVKPPSTWFNWLVAVTWSLYAPVAIVAISGAYWKQRRGGGLAARSHGSWETDRRVIFTLPSLCCSQNANALRRVIHSIIQNAPHHFTTWRLDIVTEETADAALLEELRNLPDTNVLVVPAGYSTPGGAHYKARANHYALENRRTMGENGEDTYIYHLDDDTHVGPDTVASLAEFIERNDDRYLLAQGTLTFPRELTYSPLSWYCDAIRPADDVTRFAFFTGFLGSPLGGLHGEHLIVRADVEDEIGWDFRDTLVEDAYFGLEFARRYAGRSTTLNSFSYGASPPSVRELLKQRRRWIEGLLRLAFSSSVPLKTKLPLVYTIICWAFAPIQYLPLVVLIAYVVKTPSLPPYWPIVGLWALGVGTLIWQYVVGLKLNVMASAALTSKRWRSLICVLGLYVFVTIETFAAILGIIRLICVRRHRHFEVIAKPL